MLFLDSFEMFAIATGLPYERRGSCGFVFPVHNLFVQLVPLQLFSCQNSERSNNQLYTNNISDSDCFQRDIIDDVHIGVGGLDDIAENSTMGNRKSGDYDNRNCGLHGEIGCNNLTVDALDGDEYVGYDRLFLYEDRWFHDGAAIRKRLLCRLGCFKSIFARNCKVLGAAEFCTMFISGTLPERIVSKISDFYDYRLFLTKLKSHYRDGHVPKSASATALNVYIRLISDFLSANHSYGAAKCSFRYMLLYRDDIVAVATFSAPKIIKRLYVHGKGVCKEYKQSKEEYTIIRVEDSGVIEAKGAGIENNVNVLSYEWVRYASLPDTRIVGGMGKLLNAFLRAVNHSIDGKMLPIEVMSYSDNEWSSGNVYEQLGFVCVGERRPVEYYVDMETFTRYNTRQFKLMRSLKDKSALPGAEHQSLLHDSEKSPEQDAGAKSISGAGNEHSLLSTRLGSYCKIRNLGSKKFLLEYKS